MKLIRQLKIANACIWAFFDIVVIIGICHAWHEAKSIVAASVFYTAIFALLWYIVHKHLTKLEK